MFMVLVISFIVTAPSRDYVVKQVSPSKGPNLWFLKSFLIKVRVKEHLISATSIDSQLCVQFWRPLPCN